MCVVAFETCTACVVFGLILFFPYIRRTVGVGVKRVSLSKIQKKIAEKDINLKQVLKRFPPGDRWTPVGAEQPVFSSLTEGIEWVFQSTQERDYLIKAADGKVFIYSEQDIAAPEPEPVKTFNLYGEYE